MKKYEVHIEDWQTGYIIVEANNEEEAEAKAMDDIDNVIWKNGGASVFDITKLKD